MDNRIFINIASYRDPELWQTLDSLMTEAAEPSRLHIAICWQDDNDSNRLVSQGWKPVESSSITEFQVYQLEGCEALVELIMMPYQQAQGAGFARALCDKLFRQEQWFLQIDAHSLFAHHWDNYLIETLTKLYQKSEKPVMSSYPPSYHYTAQGQIVFAQQASRVTFNGFNAEGLPTLANRASTSVHLERGSYLVAGFIFTQGTFVTEVGNDPTIFFEGEEITLSLRAFSWGYDIYHPTLPALWHHYTRDDVPRIWHDHSLAAQQAGDVPLVWIQREFLSREHVKALLGLPHSLKSPREGKRLGSLRTRQQFEYQCGLHFQLASCYVDCLAPHFCSVYPPPLDDVAWNHAHRIYHHKQVDVSELLGAALPDKLFVHLYGLNTPRLMQSIYTPSQIMAQASRVVIECWSTPNRPPTLIRFGCWWEALGWGIIIEWPWSEQDGPYCLL